ncbi:hypothetical protein C0989_009340 [Termitomyces sp. Mn162]|nr:hypothetical protein C0989_009340 [Termitomyces sp. Mn162]
MALENPIPGHHPKPPPPPVLVNNEEEYEVEEILDSRVFCRKSQFKVKWKGYGIEDISWQPQANIHAGLPLPGHVLDSECHDPLPRPPNIVPNLLASLEFPPMSC